VILSYPKAFKGLGSGVMEYPSSLSFDGTGWSVGVLIKKTSILNPLLQHSITPVIRK
jgi:hypothetical protein